MKQFDIVYVDFPVTYEPHIQYGIRPALIYSNDSANKYSPIIHVIPFTSAQKKMMPTHILFDEKAARRYGLKKSSTLLTEQIMPINKSRVIQIIGHIDSQVIRNRINECVDVHFGRKTPQKMMFVVGSEVMKSCTQQNICPV